MSEMPDQTIDQFLGQKLGPHKTLLIPQHVPLQFRKPWASSTTTDRLPATTYSLSHQVAITHKDSSTTFGQSLLDAKFTLFSTLAGTSSAHTCP